MCTEAWGKVMNERLSILESWAHRQGLELAAECHLAKINQCAAFLQAQKTNVTELQNLACSCFRLNSLQTAALLSQENIPKNLVDAAIRMAVSVADELSRADGREVVISKFCFMSTGDNNHYHFIIFCCRYCLRSHQIYC